MKGTYSSRYLPTVTEMSPFRVRYSTSGAEVYPEPSTRRRFIIDGVFTAGVFTRAYPRVRGKGGCFLRESRLIKL